MANPGLTQTTTRSTFAADDWVIDTQDAWTTLIAEQRTSRCPILAGSLSFQQAEDLLSLFQYGLEKH